MKGTIKTSQIIFYSNYIKVSFLNHAITVLYFVVKFWIQHILKVELTKLCLYVTVNQNQGVVELYSRSNDHEQASKQRKIKLNFVFKKARGPASLLRILKKGFYSAPGHILTSTAELSNRSLSFVM